MKLRPFHKGAVVRLTDPDDCDEDFREKFDGFSEEWVRFWKEYRHRDLYVLDYREHDLDWDDGRYHIYLEPLPDYVDKDIPFYADEIQGNVPRLPEELFRV